MTFMEILGSLLSRIESEGGVELWDVDLVVVEIFPHHEASRLDVPYGKEKFVYHGAVVGRTIRLYFYGHFLSGEVSFTE